MRAERNVNFAMILRLQYRGGGEGSLRNVISVCQVHRKVKLVRKEEQDVPEAVATVAQSQCPRELALGHIGIIGAIVVQFSNSSDGPAACRGLRPCQNSKALLSSASPAPAPAAPFDRSLLGSALHLRSATPLRCPSDLVPPFKLLSINRVALDSNKPTH